MLKFGSLFLSVLILLSITSHFFAGIPLVSATSEDITPVLLDVQDPPVAFAGSDAKTHLVYELGMRNFTSGTVTVEQVEILGDGSSIATLDTAEIATRLQPFGRRDSVSSLAASMAALLFIHVTLPQGHSVPKTLVHRVHLRAEAAPPGQQEIIESGGKLTVDRQPVVVIGPPLHGAGYISADSCCDTARHTRAALPVNGRFWIAQRFAVDWEQIDDQHRIYHGPQNQDESYTIWGKEALAVTDATVASVTDKYPSQTPGQYPTNISFDEADGNSVVLDLGHRRYALYAHLQQGKIRVHAGDTVKRGQVLGLVGNSGNSIAPHLHFHLMSTPIPLAANGLPYEIDRFQVTGATAGTEAFDEAESKGTALPFTPFSPPHEVKAGMPLDQLILSFAPESAVARDTRPPLDKRPAP
ncbi:MAG: M23 family metallopeptidase [Candidatus Acidiferrales bacterium]